MNSEDHRRLALAYAAFRGERERRAPLDLAAAQKLERKLLAKPRVHVKSLLSGFGGLLLVGLALTHTLNGAGNERQLNERQLAVAQSFLPDVSERATAASRRHLGVRAHDTLPLVPIVPTILEAATFEAAVPANSGAASPASESDVGARPKTTERDLWRRVATGMRGDDPAAARRALGALHRTGNAETRSKALLGLASLELATGNCDAAASLATRVEQSHSSDHVLARRARELKSRCP
jgi:hypothetical protein